jgi:hypothetical protein
MVMTETPTGASEVRIAMPSTVGIGSVLFAARSKTHSTANGRDRRMPAPCLAVECAVPGGTSGGPVFDSRGYLVGLLSSSYDGADISGLSLVG